MFRLNRSLKPLCIAAAGALIAAAFAGCAQSGTEEKPREYVSAESPIVRSFEPYKAPQSLKSGANKVTSPVTPKHIIYENGIVLHDAEVDMSDEASEASDAEGLHFKEGNIRYYVVDGLKDKEVQKKINDTIYNTAMELYNAKLPPYRGIRTADFSPYELQKNVYIRECANFSNVLSLVVEASVYGNYDEGENYGSIDVVEVMPLNFDLRTGEQFSLSDVFADDVDYKEIINGLIADYLAKNNISAGDSPSEALMYDYGSNLSLVTPFRGISDDVKFSVNEYCVELIFDYNTPEFDTSYSNGMYSGWSPAYYSVAFNLPEVSQAAAIFSRFDTEENIYENERTVEFAVSNYPVKTTDEYYSPSDVGFDDGDYQYTNVDLYASIPAEIENETLSALINERYEAAKDETRTLAQELFSRYSGSQITMDRGYNVTRYGKFLLENDSLYADAYYYSENGDGRKLYSESYHTEKLYSEETGREVELSELFKEGVDYKTLLLEGIKKQELEWSDELKDDSYYLEVIENGDFSIYQEGISLTYKRSEDWEDYYSVRFKDIGLENLTVFE